MRVKILYLLTVDTMSREIRRNNTDGHQRLDLVEGCYIYALDLK